jgi:hypothetical protein
MQKPSKGIRRYSRKRTLKGFQNQQQTDRPEEEEGFIREPPFKRSSTPRYQTIFLVYVMHVIILDIKL